MTKKLLLKIGKENLKSYNAKRDIPKKTRERLKEMRRRIAAINNRNGGTVTKVVLSFNKTFFPSRQTDTYTKRHDTIRYDTKRYDNYHFLLSFQKHKASKE